MGIVRPHQKRAAPHHPALQQKDVPPVLRLAVAIPQSPGQALIEAGNGTPAPGGKVVQGAVQPDQVMAAGGTPINGEGVGGHSCGPDGQGQVVVVNGGHNGGKAVGPAQHGHGQAQGGFAGARHTNQADAGQGIGLLQSPHELRHGDPQSPENTGMVGNCGQRLHNGGRAQRLQLLIQPGRHRPFFQIQGGAPAAMAGQLVGQSPPLGRRVQHRLQGEVVINLERWPEHRFWAGRRGHQLRTPT